MIVTFFPSGESIYRQLDLVYILWVCVGDFVNIVCERIENVIRIRSMREVCLFICLAYRKTIARFHAFTYTFAIHHDYGFGVCGCVCFESTHTRLFHLLFQHKFNKFIFGLLFFFPFYLEIERARIFRCVFLFLLLRLLLFLFSW